MPLLKEKIYLTFHQELGGKRNWYKRDILSYNRWRTCYDGQHLGFVTMVEQKIGHSVMKLHCIIHQKSICAKILKFCSS